jgi:hypothetical protein
MVEGETGHEASAQAELATKTPAISAAKQLPSLRGIEALRAHSRFVE